MISSFASAKLKHFTLFASRRKNKLKQLNVIDAKYLDSLLTVAFWKVCHTSANGAQDHLQTILDPFIELEVTGKIKIIECLNI